MKHFNNFIYELFEGKIKSESKMERIYKKYFFLDEIINNYCTIAKEHSYYFNNFIKITNTANLIKHLIQINYYLTEKTNYELENAPSKYIFNPANSKLFGYVKKDYPIENDIILIEDRFLIKDLTKIYDTNKKCKLEELKSYLS